MGSWGKGSNKLERQIEPTKAGHRSRPRKGWPLDAGSPLGLRMGRPLPAGPSRSRDDAAPPIRARERIAACARWGLPMHATGDASTCIVFDFETTGLSPSQGDRRSRSAPSGSSASRWAQSLMNPACRSPPSSRSTRGSATPCSATRSPARTSWSASPRSRGANLMAHNASFDRRFLEAEFGRLGRQPDGDLACSMLAARRLCPEAPNHRLGTLVAHLELPTEGLSTRARGRRDDRRPVAPAPRPPGGARPPPGGLLRHGAVRRAADLASWSISSATPGSGEPGARARTPGAQASLHGFLNYPRGTAQPTVGAGVWPHPKPAPRPPAKLPPCVSSSP